MKPVLTILAKISALVGTGYLLVATSSPPCSGNTPSSLTYVVEGECGPSGTIVVMSDSSCGLTVDGGEAVFLPGMGSHRAIGSLVGQTIQLSGWVALPDGGPIPLGDGGTRERAASERAANCTPADNCPAGSVRTCSTTLAGTGSVLLLSCSTDGETCSGQLTPLP